MANRLASKWVVRSLLSPDEIWAKLLHRNIDKAKLIGLDGWRNLPHLTLFFSAWPVAPKGSQLVKSLWKAWNEIKGLMVCRANKEARTILAQDSVWWPIHGRAQTNVQDMDRARRLYNLGVRMWGDLWRQEEHGWIPMEDLQNQLNLEDGDIDLLMRRLPTIEDHDQWMVGLKEKCSIKGVGWSLTKPLFPIPQMERTPPIHIKLNYRWDTAGGIRLMIADSGILNSPSFGPASSHPRSQPTYGLSSIKDYGLEPRH